MLPPPETIDDVRHISFSLIRDACPEVGNFAPGAFTSWAALKTNVDLLARLCSINPQVVDEARRYLGSDLAAVAMAVTFQKTAVNGVAKPGAYLRSLVKRGRAGELFLSRSLFAMQAACAKPSARLQ